MVWESEGSHGIERAMKGSSAFLSVCIYLGKIGNGDRLASGVDDC